MIRKYKKCFLGCVLMSLLPFTAEAHILSITPLVTFPSQVYAASYYTASYRITNTASRDSFTVQDASLLPSGSGLSVLSSTCGVVLAPGQSCTINLQLQAPVTAQNIIAAARAWAKPSVDGVESPIFINVLDVPRFFNVQAGGNVSNNDFIAPSFKHVTSNITYPLFALSQDSGATWSQQVAALPSGILSASVSGIDCVNNFCAAVGNCNTSGNSIQPLMSISNDAGMSWQTSVLPLLNNSVVNTQLSRISCTSQSTCIAGGFSLVNFSLAPASGYEPTFVVTTNGGVTWSQHLLTVPAGTSDGFVRDVNCNGAASCVAVGFYIDNSSNEVPATMTTNDNGATWSQTVISSLPAGMTNGQLNGLTCDGLNCLAVGFFSNTNNSPGVMQSHDHGSTWSSQVLSLPAGFNSGILYDVACSGSHCVAVGSFVGDTTNNAGIATSSDSGATWTTQALNLITSTNVFHRQNNGITLQTVHCTGSTCVATGRNFTVNNVFSFPSSTLSQAVTAVSHDYGLTWTQQLLPIPSGYSNSSFLRIETIIG